MEFKVRARAEGLVAREVDGEYILLDTVADRVHQLNPSASLIWQLCCDGATVDEIAESLAEEYGLEGDVARRDVEAALAQFRELGFLLPAGSEPSGAGS